MAGDEQVKNFTDTSEPFLAIAISSREDYYEIRLVNPTNADLTDIVIKTGAWHGTDESGVVEATANDKHFPLVAANDSISTEEPDKEELDDFVIWWRISYAGREVPLEFSLFKNRDRVRATELPVVGTGWALIPRTRKA